MAGGYEHKPDGTEGVGGFLKTLQTQVNALRGGAGIRSAVLRGVQMVFQDEQGRTAAVFGNYTAQNAEGDGVSSDTVNGANFRNPETGDFLFSVRTSSSTGGTNVQAGDNGDLSLLDFFLAYANKVGINGNDVAIHAENSLDLLTGGNLRIFELPTTGSAANLHLDAGSAQIRWVTSARKYKTDIDEAAVDPADVLALVGRTWIDKGTLQREGPENVGRHIGFIAEELDTLPSLRQFVDYDADGNPDAIEYDRLTVALLAVIKDQQKHIEDHEDRIKALEATAPKKGGPSTAKA